MQVVQQHESSTNDREFSSPDYWARYNCLAKVVQLAGKELYMNDALINVVVDEGTRCMFAVNSYF